MGDRRNCEHSSRSAKAQPIKITTFGLVGPCRAQTNRSLFSPSSALQAALYAETEAQPRFPPYAKVHSPLLLETFFPSTASFPFPFFPTPSSGSMAPDHRAVASSPTATLKFRAIEFGVAGRKEKVVTGSPFNSPAMAQLSRHLLAHSSLPSNPSRHSCASLTWS